MAARPSFSSFASAMLTVRKTFSASFAASATSSERTGTGRSTTAP